MNRDEQRRAAAKSGRDDARRQPASLLEPLQRRADRSAVHERGADPGHAVKRVEHGKRSGVTEAGPTEPAEQARRADEPTRPKSIDQPPIERLDPGLEEDEQREGKLDIRQLPVRARLHRLDEQRPGVLQVRDHDHRDERRAQLKPSIVDLHVGLLEICATQVCTHGGPRPALLDALSTDFTPPASLQPAASSSNFTQL